MRSRRREANAAMFDGGGLRREPVGQWTYLARAVDAAEGGLGGGCEIWGGRGRCWWFGAAR